MNYGLRKYEDVKCLSPKMKCIQGCTIKQSVEGGGNHPFISI